MNKMFSLSTSRKNGAATGICSICSANEFVIEAALEVGLEFDTHVLIEATANQVNQFGGYTGMRPLDFMQYVQSIAKRLHFPLDNLILGGDHLGPLTWKDLPESEAMTYAQELVKQYVQAGFTKIHLDTSMRLADDDETVKLSDQTIARRAAALAQVCEAYAGPIPLAYIIGSEVPIPGGAQENEERVAVTTERQLADTYQAFEAAFSALGLEAAFARVLAVVVQPGVEFADASVIEYDRAAAAELCASLKNYGGLLFEGHSSDYQSKEKLREMVEDGIAILKVGPALTFELRQALFALCDMEREALANKGLVLSEFKDALEEAMLLRPSDWKKHYHGNKQELKLKRKYSFSDRSRYYLLDDLVQQAIQTLIANIDGQPIPISLYAQYLPQQYHRYREGRLHLDARSILKDKVKECIYDYIYATLPDTRLK